MGGNCFKQSKDLLEVSFDSYDSSTIRSNTVLSEKRPIINNVEEVHKMKTTSKQISPISIKKGKKHKGTKIFTIQKNPTTLVEIKPIISPQIKKKSVINSHDAIKEYKKLQEKTLNYFLKSTGISQNPKKIKVSKKGRLRRSKGKAPHLNKAVDIYIKREENESISSQITEDQTDDVSIHNRLLKNSNDDMGMNLSKKSIFYGFTENLNKEIYKELENANKYQQLIIPYCIRIKEYIGKLANLAFPGKIYFYNRT